MILETVYPITGNSMPYKTLITPDHGDTMYTTESEPLNAYKMMLNKFKVDRIKPGNIWVNYSPCPTCTAALLTHYGSCNNNPGSEDAHKKPTIHIARIYNNSKYMNMTESMETFQCLAKLKHEGFDIVPWNWTEFKAPRGDPVFAENCTSLIDKYDGHVNFRSAYNELEKLLMFAKQLGKNPHAGSWCLMHCIHS